MKRNFSYDKLEDRRLLATLCSPGLVIDVPVVEISATGGGEATRGDFMSTLNEAPEVKRAVRVKTTQDSPVVVDLLANSGDPNLDAELHIAKMHLISGNDAGVLVNGNELTFDPEAYQYLSVGDVEEIIYGYFVVDSNGGQVEQTATLYISGVNDAPTVKGQAFKS